MSSFDTIWSSPFSQRTYAEKTLACRDCNKTFVYAVAEQQEAASRGHHHDPSRCPDCQATRRQRRGDTALHPVRDAGPGAMGGRPRREMHSAICAECGSQAQVPFVPRNDRPVYCSDCFEKVRVAR